MESCKAGAAEAGSGRRDPDRHPVIAIAGPTASGKSELAVQLAEALDGTVINADSMQVYRELEILTSRPGRRELSRAPHRLYGFRPITCAWSVALWLERARAEIAAASSRGSVPVVCGGTGLYLRALFSGLAPVPEIPDAVRAAARDLLEKTGGRAFRRALGRRDPVMAARLADGDSQRLLRAWEVLEATGRSLADWQDATLAAVRVEPYVVLVLPPRDETYAACDARVESMLRRGALAEAQSVAGLDPSLPGMKAIGLPELLAHLRGEATLARAREQMQRQTRRYAKRQSTWFRHQLKADRVVPERVTGSRVSRELLPDVRRLLSRGDR